MLWMTKSEYQFRKEELPIIKDAVRPYEDRLDSLETNVQSSCQERLKDLNRHPEVLDQQTYEAYLLKKSSMGESIERDAESALKIIRFSKEKLALYKKRCCC